jgi:hypothetical protein
VHVRVDAARHERGVAAKVDVDKFRVLVDGDDLSAINDDRGVAEQVAASVDEVRRADDENGEEEGGVHGAQCKC